MTGCQLSFPYADKTKTIHYNTLQCNVMSVFCEIYVDVTQMSLTMITTLLLPFLSFVAVSAKGSMSCIAISAAEQDIECVWHLLARSNRSQSAAVGKGVDVDGMGTENGRALSLCCTTVFD